MGDASVVLREGPVHERERDANDWQIVGGGGGERRSRGGWLLPFSIHAATDAQRER